VVDAEVTAHEQRTPQVAVVTVDEDLPDEN
jgi:hypothetical protein